ncbi:alpha/beta hydrolase [Mycobacterium sp. MMS18-G62]
MRSGQHLALLLADPAGAPFGGQWSLMSGWLPTVAQALTAVVLVVAVARRARRWLQLWIPLAALIGAVVAYSTNRYMTSQGMLTKPIPVMLWIWLFLTGVAVVFAVAGWPRTRWPFRAASVLSVPLCLLCVAIALNMWVGYFPTVQLAWNQLTAGPLPDEMDAAALDNRRQRHDTSGHGAVVSVEIPSRASGFHHRRELVYLPPMWFAATPPVDLPVVMMIGAAFNTPQDWLRAGNAVATVDSFAHDHDGYAPVLVFVDVAGTFNNDTECVNGPRGNAADHLINDVPPFMVSRFGVRRPGSGWGVVGFSMGGTCAVDLAVMHPDVFNAFVDIGGDIGPTAGSVEQTTDRLFAGSMQAWETFDPRAAMHRHGQYTGLSGYFIAISSTPPSRMSSTAGHGALRHCEYRGEADNPAAAAVLLCLSARRYGIDAKVFTVVGQHDWIMAANIFAGALPWLARQLGVP